MSEKNYFEVLQSVDCRQHIERKGDLSYLSWPFAVAELKARHPDATWAVRQFAAPGAEFGAIPYCITPAGCFVCVEVTVNGVKHEQIHPVLDHKNKTVRDPDAFQVNTSIMRCLVKCIALHGLGLYIYAGEDLPMERAPSSADDDERAEALAKKVAGWLDKIQACAPDALKQLKQDMVGAFGGVSSMVPSTLAQAWIARKKEFDDAAAQS